MYTKEKRKHLGMNNNDFDMLLRNDHLSPKLQILKLHKIFKKLGAISTIRVGCFDFHVSSI